MQWINTYSQQVIRRGRDRVIIVLLIILQTSHGIIIMSFYKRYFLYTHTFTRYNMQLMCVSLLCRIDDCVLTNRQEPTNCGNGVGT